MEVITTHTNADFDTLASMIAAKKLYPGARLVFPGSLEKTLREGLEELKLPYKFERLKEIDLEAVKRLILVDVRSPARIGRFSEIAGRPGVELHIYDHHPATDTDLKGSVEVVRPYGSTTTVLTHVIREKGLDLTAREATILMAGIYEDTGFLSYPSTTEKDFEAAAFLLSRGAELSVVSDLLRRELTPDEVALLNDFLQSETTYAVGAVDVVFAEGYLEKYSGDIAVLAHKIRDIEGMECLFMLVDSGDRVHVVARSRTPEVNVGEVLKEVGGGGHPNAASATMKGVTIIQAREALLSALRKKVAPLKTAEEIMSFPAITVDLGMKIEDAITVMRRYNINAAPVTERGEIAGVITRQVVDKALYHGLGGSPVSDYMTVEFESVGPETSVEEIREKVVGHGQRLLPVIKNKKVAGVITRTDLIKLLQEELRERPGGRGAGGPAKTRLLRNVMKERLPAWLFEVLVEMGEVADSLGCRAYVVGGFVRDLLLRRENLDVDIVVEGGDGIAFAREFARLRGFRVRAHTRFKTAVVIFPDGFKVDVATARLEYYERPGALPTIEQSSLKLDLYRRDFIINTLAAALNPKKFGSLIDFFGAQKDIKDRKIRVLHNLSFVEDPTRALRAVRFAEKFGFRIEKHTLNLIRTAVRQDAFKDLSGPRLLDELKSILDEETAVKAVKRLHELGLLRLVHGDIAWDDEAEALFERAREALAWHRLLYTRESAEGWLTLLLALTDSLSEKELKRLKKRLAIVGKKPSSIIEARATGREVLKKLKAGRARKNSEVYELLKPLPIEAVIYLMARAETEEVKKTFSNYMTRLKYTETLLKGDDLKAMGVREGPRMGELLRGLLHERLDGALKTRQDEVRFVKKRLKAKDGKARGGIAKAK